jgi:hypothetical protein
MCHRQRAAGMPPEFRRLAGRCVKEAPAAVGARSDSCDVDDRRGAVQIRR